MDQILFSMFLSFLDSGAATLAASGNKCAVYLQAHVPVMRDFAAAGPTLGLVYNVTPGAEVVGIPLMSGAWQHYYAQALEEALISVLHGIARACGNSKGLCIMAAGRVLVWPSTFTAHPHTQSRTSCSGWDWSLKEGVQERKRPNWGLEQGDFGYYWLDLRPWTRWFILGVGEAPFRNCYKDAIYTNQQMHLGIYLQWRKKCVLWMFRRDPHLLPF